MGMGCYRGLFLFTRDRVVEMDGFWFVILLHEGFVGDIESVLCKHFGIGTRWGL